MGACIEARDSDSASFTGTEGAGDPVVCHLVSTDGESITDVRAVTWSTEEWADGNVTKTPMNPGTVITGASYDGTAVGFGEKMVVAPVVEETEVEEEAEAEAEDLAEAEDEEEEEFDLQDDDGWNEGDEDEDPEEDEEANTMNDPEEVPQIYNDTANATESVADAVDNFVEEVTEPVIVRTAIPRSINFHWYQPKFSSTYLNLRRFGAGNMVQAYALPLQEGANAVFQPYPINEVVMLAGATKMIAAAGVIVSAALAL